MSFRALRSLSIALLAPVILSGFALAGNASSETSRQLVLTVEIKDTATEMVSAQEWSFEKMNALPQHAINTNTPWTNGEQMFSGVKMTDFLDALGVDAGKIELLASNDYSVVTSAEFLRETGAVLAYMRNGALMPSRGKGPFWLIWDYDASPDLRRESIYSLSVWQLDQIRISQ